MTPRTTRTVVRTLHVALGLMVGALAYLPLAWIAPWRGLVGLVIVPLVVLTGVVMWKQAALRRLTRRGVDSDSRQRARS